MRITLLGGSGFIGRHLTRWLLEAGAGVTVIHRGRMSSHPGARSMIADRHDPAALGRALAAAAPSVLVDLTAYTRADMDSLVATLPPSVERLVVLSSGDVYRTYAAFLGQTALDGPIGAQSENAPVRDQLYPYRERARDPDDPMYQYEKLDVERRARGGAPAPVTILRLPMVYGAEDPQARVSGCVERLRASNGELRINAAEAGWRCTRGYVEDVAWAIRLAAADDRAKGETFNLGEPDALTELEWMRAVADTAGWRGRIIADPTVAASLPANWHVPLIADTTRVRGVLEFREPVGRDEGLRRTTA